MVTCVIYVLKPARASRCCWHTSSCTKMRSPVASLTSGVQTKLTLQEPSPMAQAAVRPVSTKALTPPRRPGYGTVGKKDMVRANHFLVKVANTDIHHYDVSLPIPSVFFICLICLLSIL
jgi:hypothetical protein